MAAELIAFGVGANWITKLYKKLKKIRKKRWEELNKINDELNVNPLELAEYYVEPECQEFNPADREEEDFLVSSTLIFKKIDKFFRAKKFDKPGNNQMFVLSDAGMGKTSLLAILKMMHLTSFWPRDTKCVVKKLGKKTIAEIIETKDKMKTVLLLDSLDEDPTAYGKVEERLLEILDATKSFHKVIITCRTQFFPKVEKDPLERPGIIKIGGYVCPSKYLSLFDDEKVDMYLSKRFSRRFFFIKKKKKIVEAKGLIKKMGSLRCRPMLLSFIDDLMESPSIQNNMSEYNIYKALVDSWLTREEAKTKKPKQEELLRSCETLSVEMHKKGLRDLTDSNLDILIAGISELKSVKNIDVKGRSLLNLNSSGSFRFSHYSIQEFLVVRYFVENPGIKVEKKLRTTDIIVQMLLDSFVENKETIRNFDLQNTILQCIDLRVTELKEVKRIYKNEKGYLEVEFAEGLVMVNVPAGEFTMGSNDGDSDEKPEHKVYLDGYWIGKYEVTFEQYDKYCEETGREKPDDSGWGRGKRPVIKVSWEDATAYCEWLKKKTGLNFRLPTEAHWEKAARGTDGRVYPWGNEFDKNKCNSEESRLKKTSPVGKFPDGASPYGCFDMAGNVWEWCSDWYEKKYYEKSPDKNPIGPNSGSKRVMRGGSWYDDAAGVRCAVRDRDTPDYRVSSLGLRLCQDI
jgi:formylglycine-generating enzyme required for sulfatase activity